MSFGLGNLAEVAREGLATVEGGEANRTPRLVVDFDAEEAETRVRVHLVWPSATT